jgi:hypothetical protein
MHLDQKCVSAIIHAIIYFSWKFHTNSGPSNLHHYILVLHAFSNVCYSLIFILIVADSHVPRHILVTHFSVSIPSIQ